MPVLQNPKHERFAQELAQGKSAIEAHEVAGYKPDRGTASKLQHLSSISLRVAELLDMRNQKHIAATERAVEKLSLTKEWVIAGLMENAQRALERQAVTDAEGNVVQYKYEGNVANRAFELLGKELGMFIERRETGVPGEFAAIDSMSGPELLAFLAQKVAPADAEDETRH